MKKYLLVLLLLIPSLYLLAHKDGHGTPLKEWNLETETTSLKADFIKFENNTVWLMDINHNVQTYDITDFSAEDQDFIKARNELIQSLNSKQTSEVVVSTSQSQTSNVSYLKITLIILGGLLLLFSIFQLVKRKKMIHLTYGFLGIGMILFVSCDGHENTAAVFDVPQNDVAKMTSLFETFEGVEVHTDEEYVYISSNGLPNHDMMTGITNWQQQVPINQNYTGDNSWAIPIHPKMSAHPLSTKTNLLKGAIAVAANGIPIFNPLNNRGEDANAIGELDQWGGHCGRADDYHYHLPPLHLQDQVGQGNPIAYAVDGFPVYGETTDTLDQYLGKLNADGSYQYHTIKEYPYFIAAMRGEVKLDPKSKAPENQVHPQPRTHELRPALQPLKGAKIVGFKKLGDNSYELKYTLNSDEYIIKYYWDNANKYTYEFINPDGTSKTETYQR